ncbi:MAG: FGGY-family carbohydrate kinase [Promethearchaeota archaeon]
MTGTAGSTEPLVVAVDVGTSETKAALVGARAGLLVTTSRDYPDSLSYPRPGWCDQDPATLERAVVEAVAELVERAGEADVSPASVAGLTFTGQMSNVLPVDEDGRPLAPFTSWLDSRAADLARNEMFKGWPSYRGFSLKRLLGFLRITGAAPGLTGKDVVCKLYWLKRERPDIYEAAHKFLDVKDYCAFLATGNFATSTDTAFVTWMVDNREGRGNWSPKVLSWYGLDVEKLPPIRSTTDVVGRVTAEFASRTGLPAGTPVVNGAGDLLTSAVGSGAVAFGDMHANVGTAGWVGCHFPRQCKIIKYYTGTIASAIPGTYLILSKQETLGGALEWASKVLFADLPSGKSPYEAADRAVSSTPPGAGGLLFAPWLFGERSPVNNPYARGLFFNLGWDHGREHLVRAVYEGVAFNLRWGLELVERLSGSPRQEVRVIGGATRSDVWCQVFADAWQRRVVRVRDPQQASAVGAACVAFMGLGFAETFERAAAGVVRVDRAFEPNRGAAATYQRSFDAYVRLYQQNRDLFLALNEGAE